MQMYRYFGTLQGRAGLQLSSARPRHIPELGRLAEFQ